jgi:hypothetical protein
MKKKILLQAAPFCFGPASTLLSIARHFENGFELMMIDEGPTGDLLKLSGLDIKSIQISTIHPSKELDELIRSVDIVVSNTDLEFAKYCIDHQVAKLVIIDTLFWMWDDIDKRLFGADLYVIQDFMGTENQLNRLGSPRNYLSVGPLINWVVNQENQQKKDQVLISLGGCDCVLFDSHNDPFPSLISRLIRKSFGESQFKDYELVLTVGAKTKSSLQSRTEGFEIKTLSNTDNQLLMGKVHAILLSPGLTATFEAIHSGTPIFFLPPQNYSQVIQLDEYKKLGIAPYSFTWSDAYPEFSLPNNLPETIAVERVRQVVDRFLSDEAAQQVFQNKLDRFIQSGIKDYEPKLAKEFLNKIGTDGVKKATDAILDLIKT